MKRQDSSVYFSLLQEVSGVDDAALSISIRLTFYVFWNDSRVIRLKDGDLNIQLGSAALEKYFLPDFYIYNLLDFKQSEFADPLKALLLTPEGKMWYDIVILFLNVHCAFKAQNAQITKFVKFFAVKVFLLKDLNF